MVTRKHYRGIVGVSAPNTVASAVAVAVDCLAAPHTHSTIAVETAGIAIILQNYTRAGSLGLHPPVQT